MKSSKRVAIAIVLTLALLLTAAPAFANTDSGTINCGTNNIAVRVMHSKGSNVYIDAFFQDSNYTSQGTATWTETTTFTGTHDWAATSWGGGIIYTASTYAFCWGS